VQRRENAAGYLFMLPWLIGFFGITFGPIVASLVLSFTDYSPLSTPHWIGLDNYVELFTADPRFLASLGVTLTYVVVSVPLSLGAALLVAVILNQHVRFAGFYRALIYVPSLMGASVAAAIAWRSLFGTSGPVASFMASVGVPDFGAIGDPRYALWVLIILHVWMFGAPMVIFLAAIRQVPSELYDAAAVDGASRLRKFLAITMPVISPVVLFNLMLTTIGAFQAFTAAYVVSQGSGGPADSTLFYSLYLYQRGFQSFQMGYASAMGWLLLLMIAACSAFMLWTSRFWVFYGD
jgi:multiple sugar transport system permease protein